MKAAVKVLGVKELIKNLERLGGNVDTASRDALWAAGAYLEGALKQKLSQAGTGREYKTGFKGERHATHRASVAGQPPAPDTGRLRASITHTVNKAISTPYTFRTGSGVTNLPDPGGGKGMAKGLVGTNVEYGAYLEFGTSRMAARPWLYSTIAEEADRVVGIVKLFLKKAIQKAKKR